MTPSPADIRSEIASRRWQMARSGRPTEAVGGRRYDVLDPTTGQVLTDVPDADESDVALAHDAADAAYRLWRHVAPRERAHVVRRLADVLEQHTEELARLDAVDLGSPLREMRLDVARGVDSLRLFADWALALAGETIPASSDHLHYTRREPWGVVARIVPFNHPFMFAAGKIAAPLMAGNAVLLKPAHQTPLSALRLAELASEVLPDGLLQVLTGSGPETGRAIVRHPGVRRIAFIGSEAAGRSIQRDAAETAVKQISLELGGKNAVLVCADADLAAAALGTVRGMNITASTGQSCGSGTRLLVHRSVQDQVVGAIREHLATLVVGDPLDEVTQVGPVVSAEQQAKVDRYLSEARTSQAEVWTAGHAQPGLGYFVEPTVISGLPPYHPVASEEIFGPVLTVLPFDTEEEAVELANRLDLGLTAAIWTADVTRAHRLANAVEAGFVWVNGSSAHFPGVPYGGYKNSGIGREECLEELLGFTQTKAVTVFGAGA